MRVHTVLAVVAAVAIAVGTFALPWYRASFPQSGTDTSMMFSPTTLWICSIPVVDPGAPRSRSAPAGEEPVTNLLPDSMGGTPSGTRCQTTHEDYEVFGITGFGWTEACSPAGAVGALAAAVLAVLGSRRRARAVDGWRGQVLMTTAAVAFAAGLSFVLASISTVPDDLSVTSGLVLVVAGYVAALASVVTTWHVRRAVTPAVTPGS